MHKNYKNVRSIFRFSICPHFKHRVYVKCDLKKIKKKKEEKKKETYKVGIVGN